MVVRGKQGALIQIIVIRQLSVSVTRQRPNRAYKDVYCGSNGFSPSTNGFHCLI
jgi:hypothetical protein